MEPTQLGLAGHEEAMLDSIKNRSKELSFLVLSE